MMEIVKKEFSDFVRSNAKVKLVNVKVEETADSIFNFIAAVNALPEVGSQCAGLSQKEVELSKWVVPFVYPRAIRFDVSSFNYTDLLSRGEAVALTEEDYYNYRKATSLVETWFKLSPMSNVTTVEDARKVVSLSDVIDKVSFNGKCRLLDTPYVPIPVHHCVRGLIVEEMPLVDVGYQLTAYMNRVFKVE